VLFRDGAGKSKQLQSVRTDKLGYFSFTAPYRANRSWRAVARAPDGTVLRGPFTYSFVFRG
jgi:hypothetical protein